MESYPINQSLRDLHQSRSRASSQASLGESRFRGLNINDARTEPTSHSDLSCSSSNLEAASGPVFLNPGPQLCAPLPLSSQSAVVEDWSYLESTEISDAPRLRLQQPQVQVVPMNSTTTLLSSEPESYEQENMSILGVQYDVRFDASVRGSYTWPVFDVNETYNNSDLGVLDPFNHQTSVPIYSRSFSSSPPLGFFTPEQREVKRQRDQARKDSKSRVRRDRSTSNSYVVSRVNTPDMISQSVDNYTSAMNSAAIMAEVSLPISNPNYLSSCSPQLPSTSASPEIYGTPFSLVSNDFGGFLTPYTSNPQESFVPSYPNRPHSMSSASDTPYFYRDAPTSAPVESPDTVRIVHSRPKPQCWEHGCNGRQFSTFSNLLRHQREKSGAASKPSCPKCGAEFTRTTARNGHMAHEKCKQRRNS